MQQNQFRAPIALAAIQLAYAIELIHVVQAQLQDLAIAHLELATPDPPGNPQNTKPLQK